ncbi:helix-turn-helix domain-containing protein [Bdellovibrio sp. 22V]|uniref:winged helix-turn-helix transcriptional regulator n=1 Tax=Bdellovibrio TaxID=958 RepID=UPI0032EC9C1B
MKRKSLKQAPCPVARALDSIGDWWSLLIIRDAFDKVSRFGEFQKSLDIAKNILAERLKHLVDEGVLEIRPAADGSAYQEYHLTEKGESLFTVIVALRQWGEDYFFKNKEKHSVLLDTKNAQPLRRIEVRAQSGRLVKPRDTFVRKINGT